MNFGNMGFFEILILLVLVLLLFGAKRLPEIGSSMGKGIREFKRSITDVGDAINEPAPRGRLESRDRDRDLRAGEPAARRDEDDRDRPEPKRLLS